MERWTLLRKGADFERISRKFGISPRLACLIRNRDVVGDEAIERYLNGTVADLYDGMLMKDMDKAIDILREKIADHEKVRIIGDYDIDGVNATYILLEGLEALGADVDSDIPDRIRDGYGLNRELIERAFQDGIDTIVTCDNGIAAQREIAYGKELGMTIIVTDHHEVPYEEAAGEDNGNYEVHAAMHNGVQIYDGNRDEGKRECGRIRRYRLPPADAVIDPKQPGCEYPFKGLCGAAVAYKLVEALYESMGKDAEDLDYLIENVAIATVGDVMDLEDENRILVKEGLAMLGRTHNLGLRSLMECSGIDKSKVSAYHIGFVLGPCLNAGGRLDTAKRALALLRAKDKKEADILAGDLKALNDSRKELTEQAVSQAVELAETTAAGEDRVLVLYLPGCHESIAGIVAGRIRERYYKPVFILTDAEDGIKGSGRSIEAYHMYEGISRCQDLLTKYGGHAMAAGLSMRPEHLEEFRRRLNEQCDLTKEDLSEKIVIDMEMPFSCVTESLVQELSLLEPYGKGNTKPVFAARNVEILSGRILGKNHNVLKMQVKDGYGTQIEAMLFRGTDAFLEMLEAKFGHSAVEAMLGGGIRNSYYYDSERAGYGRAGSERAGSGTGAGRKERMVISVTYYPDLNEYMGRVTPQIVITHYR